VFRYLLKDKENPVVAMTAMDKSLFKASEWENITQRRN
jgi:hypothetical protein